MQDTAQFGAINISSGVGAQTASVTTVIGDDDAAPTISIDNVTVNECRDDDVHSDIESPDDSTGDVRCGEQQWNPQLQGSDYVAIGAGVTGSIATGATTTTITVNINNDYIKV